MHDIAWSLRTMQSYRCQGSGPQCRQHIGNRLMASRRRDMNALKQVTFAAGMALAPIDAGGAEPSGWQALADERAVIRIADAIDRAVDAQDWKLARSYFADRVTA